jgi:tRNA(fMet)-specific endonuclease VapC
MDVGRFGRPAKVRPRNGTAYGPIREATRNKSRDALDKLIAAHAVALDVALVTNNQADFAGYPGLRVERWVAPRP